MTEYEKLALAVSILALLIPILQVIVKLIIRPQLEYYPTGRAYLMFNRSGSYFKLEGVFEAKRKPISIKNMSVHIRRKKDGASKDFEWSSFESPVSQRLVGAIASSTELAHPFRIDADNVACAFTEFSDFYQSAEKRLQPFFDKYNKALDIQNMENNAVYEVLGSLKVSRNENKDLKDALADELFWQISEYDLQLKVHYGNRDKVFSYRFEVTAEDYAKCEYNLNETIRTFLKDRYGIPYGFKPVQVRIREKKANDSCIYIKE